MSFINNLQSFWWSAWPAPLYLVAGKLFKCTGTYMDPFKAAGAAMILYIWLAPLLIPWTLISRS
jgi:hypothetical protein